jgi:hypothetical protein
MNKTIQYSINFILLIVIILIITHYIMGIIKDFPGELKITDHKYIINGDNLTVVWRTNFETDAMIQYQNDGENKITINSDFKKTHNLVLQELSGEVKYNISSCTQDGICNQLKNVVNI